MYCFNFRVKIMGSLKKIFLEPCLPHLLGIINVDKPNINSNHQNTIIRYLIAYFI